ncbi:hypothetical protein AB1Y20_014845 [Prymnesium parvum]|uniref:Uncharacterized protein n=1 Tax=Prymnesium parvum TaxID=97485 RepID=A0AB34JW41_PRYPA
MLRALMAFGACTLTLQRAVAEVRASHALCGAEVLAEAERRAARLQEQQVEALEGWKPYALVGPPAHNCCVRPGEIAAGGPCAVPRNG